MINRLFLLCKQIALKLNFDHKKSNFKIFNNYFVYFASENFMSRVFILFKKVVIPKWMFRIFENSIKKKL